MKRLLAKIGLNDRGDIRALLREMASFAAVGAVNISVQYGVYHLLLNLQIMGAQWYYTLCNILSIAATWLVSHVLYSLFVFRPRGGAAGGEARPGFMAGAKGRANGRLVRLAITNTGYLLLSSLLIIFFVRCAGAAEETAPLFCVAALIPYSFCVTKWYVYKN
jgi:putative flippase GtrA